MSIIEAIIFGLVQGITEFLPISSTAHIVIAGYLLGQSTPGLTFEIYLHMASLLAVILYFRKDIRWLVGGFFKWITGSKSADDQVAGKFAIYLVIATLVTGVCGILLLKTLGDSIKTPMVVGSALFGTAVLLIIVERIQDRAGRGLKQVTVVDAIVVGLAQAVAVVPGISRAGATLMAGLALQLNRETAVRFSFLLAIPILVGSSVMVGSDVAISDLAGLGVAGLIVSFAVSFIASWISILWLIKFLQQQRLYWFSIYLVLLALAVFFLIPADTNF